jgi:hypothetical protein
MFQNINAAHSSFMFKVIWVLKADFIINLIFLDPDDKIGPCFHLHKKIPNEAKLLLKNPWTTSIQALSQSLTAREALRLFDMNDTPSETNGNIGC